jgi:hypothetical protein
MKSMTLGRRPWSDGLAGARLEGAVLLGQFGDGLVHFLGGGTQIGPSDSVAASTGSNSA